MSTRTFPFSSRALRAAMFGASVLLASASAWAQSNDPSFDQLEWTGRAEAPSIARKEALASRVEGRRECARKGGDRSSCLRKVESDYAEMLKRSEPLQTAKR